MPSKRIQPGSPDSEAYELLSRDHSLDIPADPVDGRTSLDDQNRGIHRRPRSQSQTERHRGEEIVGLLGGSSWSVKRRLRFTGGLAVALELITQSTPSLLAAVVGSVM